VATPSPATNSSTTTKQIMDETSTHTAGTTLGCPHYVARAVKPAEPRFVSAFSRQMLMLIPRCSISAACELSCKHHD
jgi:hypothetical protein